VHSVTTPARNLKLFNDICHNSFTSVPKSTKKGDKNKAYKEYS
jgi:hypothetical protein